MTNYKFKCNDCGIQFSFESEQSDINKFKEEMGGVKCPKCQKVWGEKESSIDQIINAGPLPDKTKAQRAKENAERTKLAMQQANMAKQQNPEKMVSVKRSKNMGAPSRYGSSVEKVPEKVVDSLKGKVTPNDE